MAKWFPPVAGSISHGREFANNSLVLPGLDSIPGTTKRWSASETVSPYSAPTSGEEILTLRMLRSIISWLSHQDSKRTSAKSRQAGTWGCKHQGRQRERQACRISQPTSSDWPSHRYSRHKRRPALLHRRTSGCYLRMHPQPVDEVRSTHRSSPLGQETVKTAPRE